MTSDYQDFLATCTTFEREFQVYRRPGDSVQPDDITATFHRIEGILNKAYHVLSNDMKRDGKVWEWEANADYIIPYEFPLVNVYLEGTRDSDGKGHVLLGASHYFPLDKRFPLLEEIAKKFELTANEPFKDGDGGDGIVELLKAAYSGMRDDAEKVAGEIMKKAKEYEKLK
jgi:hypothetical protein